MQKLKYLCIHRSWSYKDSGKQLLNLCLNAGFQISVKHLIKEKAANNLRKNEGGHKGVGVEKGKRESDIVVFKIYLKIRITKMLIINQK